VQQQPLRRALRCDNSVSRPRLLSLPFNRTSEEAATLGGSTIGLSLKAGYLVGTNLNCKNAQFSYEASANAQADILLFGHTINAFDALFVYGQNGGLPLADELKLSVFGDNVYDTKIPSLQYCVDKDIPLGHINKNFDETYTVWVSIVPVVFSASAELDLQLDWDYRVCTNDLSASIGITPTASVTFSGAADVDLLILGAGTSLSASIGANVQPQAFIDGSLCSVGSDAVLNKQGISGHFDAYYKWRHCKFIIWDCSWGEHHVTTFWQKNSSPEAKTLYNHTYCIK